LLGVAPAAGNIRFVASDAGIGRRLLAAGDGEREGID